MLLLQSSNVLNTEKQREFVYENKNNLIRFLTAPLKSILGFPYDNWR